MLATPKNGSTTGQNSAAVQDATDIYFSVNSTSMNSAVAASVMRQSTNQMVANPAMNALPPLKRYHTGKQCPSIAQSPANCAPNCHSS